MGLVDRHRAAHEAFNRRDWDDVVRDFAPRAEYLDHPRGMTLKGPQQFIEYLQRGWTSAFSDAQVTRVRYAEAGDRSVAQFEGSGTNDGPLGPFPATGRTMHMSFCEVLRFDDDGHVVAGELYYDQVTMLVQLGHMPSPAG